MVSISGGRSPHQLWGIPGEPQSLPTSQVHNWREGRVGILWSHPPLEIFSLPLLLYSFISTFIFMHPPSSFVFHSCFFPLSSATQWPWEMLSWTGSPCGSLVWSLGSSKSISPNWVFLCRDQQVTLPWAHTVSQPCHFFNGSGKFPMSYLPLTDRL